MTYLLDTCAAIWIMDGAQVSKHAANAIDNSFQDNQNILICPYTAWEIGMLCARGRLALIKGPIAWYNDLISINGFEEAFLSPAIMVESSFLKGNPPKDPGDRMIIATANAYDATIITRDKKILAYGNEGGCRVLEC